MDDVIIVGDNMQKIHDTNRDLVAKFSIKGLGPLQFFLSIEVSRTQVDMILSQWKYTLDILEDVKIWLSTCFIPYGENFETR